MEKIKYWLADYSHVTIVYLFWGYFLIYSVFHSFLPEIFTYLFFLISGVYIGYKFAVFSYDYLRKNKK